MAEARKGRGGARAPATPGSMKGGIRRPRGPGGGYSYTVELGAQPAQRCPACTEAKRRPARWWLDGKPLDVCPSCGGELRETRERRTEIRGGFATYKEAVAARDRDRNSAREGAYVARSTMTLGEYLEERWLPTLAAGNLKKSTAAGYRSHVENYLSPTKLGRTRLGDLNRDAIAAHYAWLREHGRVHGGKDKKPLATSTVERIHATLHRALRDAVRSKLLPGNPADDIELARGAASERSWWDSAQLTAFLESAREDRLAPLWLLYSTTGARRGELLALQWSDVDTERAKLRIRRSRITVDREIVDVRPKTKSGIRTISLDPESLRALRQQKKRRAQDKLRSSKWQDTDYVFTDEDGGPLRPDAVTKHFDRLVKASGLPRITVHGLRHTNATIALNELRQPVAQVSQRLGHANVGITLSIYSHAIEKQDETLAADFAALVVPEGY